MPAERRLETYREPALAPPVKPTITLGATSRQPRISVEVTIDGEHHERFYQLYVDAFGPLRAKAVTRQVLHRQEFIDQMTDPRVSKYVAWNASGEPSGLTTLTHDLATVPWISPEYFAAHYPEHTARDAVYYVGFMLTSPSERNNRAVLAMLSAVVRHLSAKKAVCGFDVCAYNEATISFGKKLEAVSLRIVDVQYEIVDSQSYYTMTYP